MERAKSTVTPSPPPTVSLSSLSLFLLSSNPLFSHLLTLPWLRLRDHWAVTAIYSQLKTVCKFDTLPFQYKKSIFLTLDITIINSTEWSFLFPNVLYVCGPPPAADHPVSGCSSDYLYTFFSPQYSTTLYFSCSTTSSTPYIHVSPPQRDPPQQQQLVVLTSHSSLPQSPGHSLGFKLHFADL